MACEYCDAIKEICDYEELRISIRYGKLSAQVFADADMVSDFEVPINNCPMCGERLVHTCEGCSSQEAAKHSGKKFYLRENGKIGTTDA